MEVSTHECSTGELRIIGEGAPTLFHNGENLFAITSTDGNATVGKVLLEGLRFQSGSEATVTVKESNPPEVTDEP